MNKISIIIPILNEANSIVSLLQHLFDNSSRTNISEIIVVDGGSKDESFKLVSEFSLVTEPFARERADALRGIKL